MVGESRSARADWLLRIQSLGEEVSGFIYGTTTRAYTMECLRARYIHSLYRTFIHPLNTWRGALWLDDQSHILTVHPPTVEADTY